ncbi:hypothetical protein CLU79DRAFT_699815 [Phycomyces nitens]|nr:hypothetical protein CLU79DRAFT_699815 [Phycomyces nitens]
MDVSPRLQQRAYKCSQALIYTHRQLVTRLLRQNEDSVYRHTFLNSLDVCESRLVESLKCGRYTLAIACARLLTSVVEISLTTNTSEEDMDVDNDITYRMTQLGTNVVKHLSCVDLNVVNETGFLNKAARWQLYEILKVKARLCLLLVGWDCETSFREAFQVMTVANGKYNTMSSILLPYLSSISCKCKNLSQWLPSAIIDTLRNHHEHPLVFVNLMRLLFRATRNHSLDKDPISEPIVKLLREFGSWDEKANMCTRNAWYLYLVGKEAGVYGWYQVMHCAISDLTRKVRRRKETTCAVN